MTKLTPFLTRFYHKISPFKLVFTRLVFLTDRSCRFSPTCSQYTSSAVGKYGIIKGVWLGVKRVLRCHPFFKGGFDPVP